jgi:hypothetical protein
MFSSNFLFLSLVIYESGGKKDFIDVLSRKCGSTRGAA